MAISFMTDFKHSAVISKKEKTLPDDSGFENKLQENLPPPEDPSPPASSEVEGAPRKEADLQPNADDQLPDQPQEESTPTPVPQILLWQTILPEPAPAASPEAATKMTLESPATSGEEVKSGRRVELQQSQVCDGDDTTISESSAVEAIENVPQIAAVSEGTAAEMGEDSLSDEAPEDITVESVEVAETKPETAPKTAQEQIQVKPHSLDRPAVALDEVREARQVHQPEGSLRAAHVRVNVASETFGNLNIVIKSAGQSVEADVQTSHSDLNRALHTHRPDLVQSVESRGMTLDQFDVRHHDQGQDGRGAQEQAATAEDLERAARLNAALGDKKLERGPSSDLLNTLA